MYSNRDRYINKLISFDYYTSNYIAMCVGINVEGKLICYRVRKKTTPHPIREVQMEDVEGNNLGYAVEYRCKFSIHPGCARKILLECEKAFVQKVNQLYRQLPPLEEQLKAYKELKTLYYHSPKKEAKQIIQQMGQLSYEIDARCAIFLQERKTAKGQSGRYRNYRTVPNKNGIARIYKGGGCSGK